MEQLEKHKKAPKHKVADKLRKTNHIMLMRKDKDAWMIALHTKYWPLSSSNLSSADNCERAMGLVSVFAQSMCIHWYVCECEFVHAVFVQTAHMKSHSAHMRLNVCNIY